MGNLACHGNPISLPPCSNMLFINDSLSSLYFVFQTSCFPLFHPFFPIQIHIKLLFSPLSYFETADRRLQSWVVKTTTFIPAPSTLISKMQNLRMIVGQFLLTLGRKLSCERRCSKGKSSRIDAPTQSHHNPLDCLKGFNSHYAYLYHRVYIVAP